MVVQIVFIKAVTTVLLKLLRREFKRIQQLCDEVFVVRSDSRPRCRGGMDGLEHILQGARLIAYSLAAFQVLDTLQRCFDIFLRRCIAHGPFAGRDARD